MKGSKTNESSAISWYVCLLCTFRICPACSLVKTWTNCLEKCSTVWDDLLLFNKFLGACKWYCYDEFSKQQSPDMAMIFIIRGPLLVGLPPRLTLFWIDSFQNSSIFLKFPQNSSNFWMEWLAQKWAKIKLLQKT